MPVNLNLLPPELSISKNLRSILKTFKALGVIAVGAFLVFSVAVVAIYVISKITLGNINTKVTALKNQVATQEKSEQQIVLLENRLAKIGTIQNLPNSLTNLTAVEPLLSNFSQSVSVDQMQFTTKGVDLSLNIKTNSDLKTFLSSIQNSKAFGSVDLTSFSLNPTTGYLLEVSMSK